MQSALQGSKYLFFLRYEAGSLYKPSTRDFEIELQHFAPSDAERMYAIGTYWENEDEGDADGEDELHPDYRIPT